MKIIIIDYGCGNLKCVSNSLNYLGYDAKIISKYETIDADTTIILPGVGSFKNAMKNLQNEDLDKLLNEARTNGNKIIGICLGMQLLMNSSEEEGKTKGLGFIDGKVESLEGKVDFNIPHMGWNEIVTNNNDFKDYSGDFYFVHSFICIPSDKSNILFETNYGINFASGITDNSNIFGIQFHPEKSQKAGLRLLEKLLKC
tara:strand:- start:1051 stop:1650 length:600 start_codon:yes stop_codon:yes gene_type:complete